MKQYPKYKASKISWIGDVPEHWENKRLAIAFSENKKKNSEYIFKRAFKFNYGTLVNKNEHGDLEELKDTYIAYTLLEPKDIVINCLNLNYDFVSLRVAQAQTAGIITSAYLTITPRPGINSDFYTYFFKAMDYKKLFHGMGTGIRLTLSYSELKKQNIIIPPADEQQAIVEFLDTAVDKIDRYIAAKEAEIEKLGTLKQSVISQAVTKGLNPNAPMKDSGIPWIGDVPEHWEKMRTKNMFVRMNRPVEPDDEVITCFRDGQVTLRKNRRTDGFTESFKEIGYQGIRPGDLVVHQMDAFAGAIGVSDSKGKGTPVYICLQPQGEYSNFYYAYLLREMARKGYIKSLYRGIRERSSDFRYDTLGKLFLPIPPYSEQQAIVNYIDAQVQKIDISISNIRQQIEKLKVYKQRLISDAVTGKIDVRDHKNKE